MATTLRLGEARETRAFDVQAGDVVVTASTRMRVEFVRVMRDGTVRLANGRAEYDLDPETRLQVVPAAEVREVEIADPGPKLEVPPAAETTIQRYAKARPRSLAGKIHGGRTKSVPTERQVAFLRDLVDQVKAAGGRCDASADAILEAAERHDDPRAELSRYLDVLAARRDEARRNRAAAPTPAVPDVPEGRYAIEVDGELKFYRVKDGRRPGFKFVDAVSGGVGTLRYFPIRNFAHVVKILEAIEATPDALARFGREIGACARCGSPLTDPESRAAGLGPVCVNK